MKIKLSHILLLASLAYPSIAQEQETITDQQKTEVLEDLKNIVDSSNSKRMRLIKAGIAAIGPAAENENEAMALFERCHKKTEFDDKNKKDKDWREWKAKNKDGLNSPVNKRLLKYQARWAMITLKAAMEPEDTYNPEKYAPQAIALLSEIMQDAKVITARDYTFRVPFITGPVGKVYELTSCKPQGWPDNIMNASTVIEQLVLAPCREKGDIANLRQGWNSLIKIEKIKEEALKKAKSEDDRNTISVNSTSDSTHIEYNIENLAWMREVDCFKAGEKVTATNNMMAIIRKTTNTEKLQQYATVLAALLDEGEDKNTHVEMNPRWGIFVNKSKPFQKEKPTAKKDQDRKSVV